MATAAHVGLLFLAALVATVSVVFVVFNVLKGRKRRAHSATGAIPETAGRDVTGTLDQLGQPAAGRDVCTVVSHGSAPRPWLSLDLLVDEEEDNAAAMRAQEGHHDSGNDVVALTAGGRFGDVPGRIFVTGGHGHYRVRYFLCDLYSIIGFGLTP
jgi:hypothetical protein